MHTHIDHIHGFLGLLLHRLFAIPFLRELLGATLGMTGAWMLYTVAVFLKDMVGVGIVEASEDELHAAASLVLSQGTAGVGVVTSMVLAAGCAWVHRAKMIIRA